MANYSTNEFKNGLKVMVDDAPCNIIECEFVKPGKGQAFTRVKIRNLKTGRVVERTFKSNESLPSADVADMEISVGVGQSGGDEKLAGHRWQGFQGEPAILGAAPWGRSQPKKR